jgi:zinc transport system substrate-binding protein
LALAGLVLVTATVAHAQKAATLDVAVTSKPVHALVASVMRGVGTPTLIVEGAASPHTFTLKPSTARAITRSDVFFRISESIEPFTRRLVRTLPKSVAVVTLAETKGLTLFERRQGATFEKDGHGHGHDHDHGGGKDGHVWLDPANAKLIVDRIAAVLSEKAPQHGQAFTANATAAKAEIDTVAAEIATRMAPLAGKPFVVFHDATQYFERRFGLQAAGSITVSPDVQPSAKRLDAVRKRLKATEAVCVFAEPAYDARLVTAVTEGTSARAGKLDPEGLLLDPGPGLYAALMRGLAAGFEGCLGAKV